MKKLLIVFVLFHTILYAKNDRLDDEDLRLMYQSFIYSKNLSHAYAIAKDALKRYPHSLYWHQKLSDVALWSGKNSVAMDHMIYIYRHTHDPAIVKKIIKQMVASYQYEKALPYIKQEFKKSDHHSENSIKAIITAYSRTGRPEDAIKTLQEQYKKDPSAKYLSAILALQMELGDIKNAQKSVALLSHYQDNSPQTALALSKYYFLKKDLHKAYAALLRAKRTDEWNHSEYFKRLSDLAWYLNDQDTALYASLVLYRNHHARMVDLDRINKVYKATNVSLLRDVSQVALKKFKKPTLLLDNINENLEKKNFKELKLLMRRVLADKESRALVEKNGQFWFAKAMTDDHFGKKALAREEFQKAMKLATNTGRTQAAILWYLINHYYYDALEKMVHHIEQEKSVPEELYYPLSAAYLALQKRDKALSYFHKAFKREPDNISLQFLYTEILASLGEEQKKRKILKLIFDKLDKQSTQHPEHLKDKRFMREYLQSSFAVFSPKKVDMMIETAKKRLRKKDYLELKMLVALKEKDYQKAQRIYSHYPHKNPNIELEIATLSHNTQMQKKLMQKLSFAAPDMLKIKILEDENKMDQAINIAKDSLKENRRDRVLIDKLASLQKEYGNKFGAHMKYEKRGDISVSATALEDFYYVANGYGLISKIEYYHYKNRNKMRLAFKHRDETVYHLGLRKHIKDGKVEATLHYRDAQKSSIGFSMKAVKSFSQRFTLSTTVQKNSPVRDESDILMIGAKKDSISMRANYKINQKQQLSVRAERLNLYALDNIKVGSGTRADLSWDYAFIKEPNIAMRVMYRYGKYQVGEKSPLLRKLLTKSSQKERLVSNDYRSVGVGISYGDIYRGYGRGFSPYLDASLMYDQIAKGAFGDLSLGVTNSFGKKSFYQLGLNYQNSMSVQHSENYGIDFYYSKLY